MTTRNGKLKLILLPVILVAAGVVYLFINGGWPLKARGEATAKPEAASKPNTRELQAIAVTVAPVTPRPIQRRVQVVGTLHGQDEMEIAPKVGGRILRIAHDVGDIVRPGDVLLEIDDTDYRLAITESERSLELDLAKLGLKQLPTPTFDVRSVPTVVRTQLLEDKALLSLQRTEKLVERNVVTQDQLEQVQTDYQVAKVNTRQTVLEAEQTLASVRLREATLETAKQRLADARILVPHPSQETAIRPAVAAAPLSVPVAKAPTTEYVVAERMVSEGEMVNASPPTLVFRLVMDQWLKLQATVPERYVGDIKIGQRVDLSVEAYPGETFFGTVARINPTIDRTNRTFQVEIHVPNDARRLHPGSFAKAAILTREEAQVTTIPEEALIQFAGVIKIFVVQDGKAHIVPVTPGLELAIPHGNQTENWLEVRGDVAAGAQVVTTGHSQLAEGTPVRIREAAPAKVEASSPSLDIPAETRSTLQPSHAPAR